MERNSQCAIVKDLLPSYLEELTSEATTEWITEHIKSCKKCRKSSELIKEEWREERIREEQGEKRIRRSLVKGLLVGIALAIVTCIVLVTVVIWLLFAGGPGKTSKNINDYGDIFQLRLRSGLVVFPEELPEDMIEGEFYYNYRDTLFDPTYQIYLRCTYEEEDWAQECERLESIRKIREDEEEKLKRDAEGKYGYPAYIAVENQNYGYEYALLTGENEITYICTNCIEWNQVEFDQKYLPTDFMTEEGRAFGSGYSIYMLSDGSSGSYQTEYDRSKYETKAEEK